MEIKRKPSLLRSSILGFHSSSTFVNILYCTHVVTFTCILFTKFKRLRVEMVCICRYINIIYTVYELVADHWCKYQIKSVCNGFRKHCTKCTAAVRTYILHLIYVHGKYFKPNNICSLHGTSM